MMRQVVQFTSDTDIQPKLAQAREYNKILNDIPHKTLFESTTFEMIANSIKKILVQLKRARIVGSYPLTRTIGLCELIAKDFDEQIKKLIN